MILFPKRKYQGRVLVVDDELDSRVMTSEVLLAQGYDAITASSGFEALDIIKSQPLDLVLLDVLMEGLDGFQTLKQIRNIPSESYLPVILLTALDKSHRDFGIEAGADDFLTKPYSIDDLIVRVKVGLRLKSLHDNLLFEKNRTAFLFRISTALNSAFNFNELAQVFKDEICKLPESTFCSLFVIENSVLSVLPSDPDFSSVRLDTNLGKETSFGSFIKKFAESKEFTSWKIERIVSQGEIIGGVFLGFSGVDKADFSDTMLQELPSMLAPVIERCILRKALHEEERRLHHIVQNSADALFLLDKNGNANSLNNSCNKLFHLPQAVPSFNLIDYISQGSQEGFRTFLSSALAGESNCVDLQLSGDARTIMLCATLFERSNQLPNLQCSAIDVTADRRQLEELSKEKSLLEERVNFLSEELVERHSFENIIGRNHRMQQIFSLIRRISNTLATVLVTGETGTGKEVVAKAIHASSPVKSGAFIKVDCGVLSPNLLESELFGHVRGAFTGAIRDKHGRFELARGGTIFLDEISNLPLELQSKLLRVLQDGSFEPVGSTKTSVTNARIIAATNEKLLQAVDEGKFRSDLYFRLNVVSISLPPLRERKEDIPVLTNHFVREFENTHNRKIEKVDRQTISVLLKYDWPGNIRELRNVIEEAVILCHGNVLHPEDLKIFSQSSQGVATINSSSLKAALSQPEHDFLLSILKKVDWNCSKAAIELDVSRTTLYKKMNRYGITPPNRGRRKKERTKRNDS